MRNNCILFTSLLFLLCVSQEVRAQCVDLQVYTRDGKDATSVCAGSPSAIVHIKPSTMVGPQLMVITDDQDNILVTKTGRSINLKGAPPGVCRIYLVSFWGKREDVVGQNVHEAQFSDYCYKLSSNYVTVTRGAAPDPATISTDDPTVICVDGNPDPIDVMVSGGTSGTGTWIITDPNGKILGLPPGPPFDLDGAGPGTCLIWHATSDGDIKNLEVGRNTSSLGGCFALSNSIEVRRDVARGGRVATTDGEEEVNTIAGDGMSDLITFAASEASNINYAYMITDTDGNILGLPPSNSQDFEGAGGGICLVWGLSYTGSILANPGDNAFEVQLTDGCYDLSENSIRVVREASNTLEGGSVELEDGTTEAFTCPGDEMDDALTFVSKGASPDAQFTFVITDPDGIILGIPEGDRQNFEGAGEGTCLVWGLAYTGNLTAMVGDDATAGPLSDGEGDLSDNFITIRRAVPHAGAVMTADGMTEVTTTPGDGVDDIVEFVYEGASDSKYAYIITDPDGNILGIPDIPSQNFEGAGVGTCLVWGLAYTGNLTAMTGDNAMDIALSDECFDLSHNFITVNRMRDVNGGTVAMPSGATTRYTCPGDGVDDIVMFVSEGASPDAQFTFVITDPDGIILGIPEGDSQNFEGAGEGACLVWGLAYTGNLTAMVGGDANAGPLSDGDSDLSDNYITINRAMANGGTVATSLGLTEITTTPGDGVDDIVEFMSSGASESKYTYVITDPDGNILGLPDVPSQNFEGAGEGTCLVWGLAYTGNITAMVGDNAMDIALSDECFDLSDNFITVNRKAGLNGGTVAMPSGATTRYTCPGDGVDDIVMFVSNRATPDAQFTYVITDPDGIILGIPDGDNQNFEGAGEGTCLVWGLAYTGNLTAMVGDDANAGPLSDGDSDLSDNYITINRAMANGGTVATSLGLTEITTTPGDGVDDIVEFMSSGASASKYTYVITDPDGNILGLPDVPSQNFEGAGEGTCLVWGLAYTGNITAMAGINAMDIALSDECFDLSDNFITVNRKAGLNGGTVAMPSGATTRYTCPGDGVDDIVMFVSNRATPDAQFTYVITDPDGIILGIPDGDNQNFEGAGEGTCLVWGLAYTGNLTAMVGDDANAGPLSDGDSDLSDNYITINRAMANGGTVATSLGLTEITTTPGDGVDDIVEFMSSGASASKYTYVITDPDGNILGLPDVPSQNFEGAGEGTCLVWGLAYTGNITAMVGDNAMDIALSDECFDLSDNFITVNRKAGLNGGTVAMPSGATTRYTCPGDGVDDIVMFVSNRATPDAQFTYVITDPDGIILGIPEGDSQNFEGAGEGTCLVWGLAYTGNLTAMVGDDANAGPLSDGDSDLSDNFITVIRATPNAGMVSTVDGLTEVTTNPGDGIDDIVEFMTEGASESKFTYVITDPDGNILGIPMGSSQNFEGAGAGTCLVWGLSYTGTLTAKVGDLAMEIDFSDECFDLSDNFITVNRIESNAFGARGLEESHVSELEIFVINPIRESIEGRFAGDSRYETVLSLYNMTGTQIKNWTLPSLSVQTINLSVVDITPGLYVLQIRNGEQVITRKLLKQN